MTRFLLQGAAALTVLAVLGAGAGHLAAQGPAPADPRTYVWWAELVSADAAANTVVARAPMQAPVASDAGRFKAGDKLLLTWGASPSAPETGPVLYLERLDVTRAANLTVGYILPVEFVSADVDARAMTFKATVQDASAFASLPARQWMKVTSPMSQPTDTAAVLSVERASAPAPFARVAPGAFLAAEPVTAIASTAEFSRAMKAIAAAFGATTASLQAKAYDDARSQLAVGVSTLKAVAAFWDARQKAEPAQLAREAVAKLEQVDAIAGGRTGIDLNALDAAMKAVGGTCAQCHGRYRDQDPVTKGYAIKSDAQ